MNTIVCVRFFLSRYEWKTVSIFQVTNMVVFKNYTYIELCINYTSYINYAYIKLYIYVCRVEENTEILSLAST